MKIYGIRDQQKERGVPNHLTPLNNVRWPQTLSMSLTTNKGRCKLYIGSCEDHTCLANKSHRHTYHSLNISQAFFHNNVGSLLILAESLGPTVFTLDNFMWSGELQQEISIQKIIHYVLSVCIQCAREHYLYKSSKDWQKYCVLQCSHEWLTLTTRLLLPNNLGYY